MSNDGSGRRDAAHGGICRGIWLTLVGVEMAGCLKAIQLPVTLNGTLIMNHIATIAIMVVSGTAPLDPFPHTHKLRKKNVLNTITGTKTGVKMMLSFHLSPPKVLYARDDTYPPTKPKIAYSTRMVVVRKPRLDGERKPSSANARVTPVIKNS